MVWYLDLIGHAHYMHSASGPGAVVIAERLCKLGYTVWCREAWVS